MIDARLRKKIIRLWDAMLPIEQIYQMLPYRQGQARKIIATLRQEGTLKPRHRKERSLQIVVDAYNNGVTNIDELAEMFSFTPNTICQYLYYGGVRRPRPQAYNPRTPNDLAKSIINELQNSNLSQTEIAKKFGVSRQYVHQLKNKM